MMFGTEPAAAIRAALAAGAAIRTIYDQGFDITCKEDGSPLTDADLAAHRLIREALGSALPLLSEEGRGIPWEERREWDRYWLVDPLDGTKEFIGRNGEFTVNIALIDTGVPVLGIVYAPVPDLLYWGGTEYGAWRIKSASRFGGTGSIPAGTMLTGTDQGSGRGCGTVRPSGLEADSLLLPGTISEPDRQPLRVIASRSHMSAETEAFMWKLSEQFGPVEAFSSGSSLKLCRVAEGTADLYPRFAPTMEWDTAAADAVCRAAGCWVVSAVDRKPLCYNKKNLRNPWFLAGRESRFIDLLDTAAVGEGARYADTAPSEGADHDERN